MDIRKQHVITTLNSYLDQKISTLCHVGNLHVVWQMSRNLVPAKSPKQRAAI
jgi:hypothetical protein